MPITNEKALEEWRQCNQDAYGGACVQVAERAMKILDEEPGDFNTYDLICQADKDSKTGGITGAMSGFVAKIISDCHSRGEEFRIKWNKDHQINDEEGDGANKDGGVINPAIINIKTD